MTPVFSIVHLRSLEASHRTTLATLAPPVALGFEPEPNVGNDDVEPLFPGRILGGKSLATHRSPWGEGVRR